MRPSFGVLIVGRGRRNLLLCFVLWDCGFTFLASRVPCYSKMASLQIIETYDEKSPSVKGANLAAAHEYVKRLQDMR